jgi:hypothetical protein
MWTQHATFQNPNKKKVVRKTSWKAQNHRSYKCPCRYLPYLLLCVCKLLPPTKPNQTNLIPFPSLPFYSFNKLHPYRSIYQKNIQVQPSPFLFAIL